MTERESLEMFREGYRDIATALNELVEQKSKSGADHDADMLMEAEKSIGSALSTVTSIYGSLPRGTYQRG